MGKEIKFEDVKPGMFIINRESYDDTSVIYEGEVYKIEVGTGISKDDWYLVSKTDKPQHIIDKNAKVTLEDLETAKSGQCVSDMNHTFISVKSDTGSWLTYSPLGFSVLRTIDVLQLVQNSNELHLFMEEG